METRRSLMEIVSQFHPKVASVDKSSMTFLCEGGNEYPLMEGCEDLTVEELQKAVDHAKTTAMSIICEIGE